jgi:hypothetical protein
MTGYVTTKVRAALSLAGLVLGLGLAFVLASPVGAEAATPAPGGPTSPPAGTNAHPSAQGVGKGMPHWLWVSGLSFCAVVIIAVGILALRGARDRESRAG